jgi:hypothetical protein
MKKLTKKENLALHRKINREIEIELGMSFNRHRVHKSKKDYKREKNTSKYLVD